MRFMHEIRADSRRPSKRPRRQQDWSPDEPGARDANDQIDERQEEATEPPLLDVNERQGHDHTRQLVQQTYTETLRRK